jgi:hypothetical protein
MLGPSIYMVPSGRALRTIVPWLTPLFCRIGKSSRMARSIAP